MRILQQTDKRRGVGKNEKGLPRVARGIARLRVPVGAVTLRLMGGPFLSSLSCAALQSTLARRSVYFFHCVLSKMSMQSAHISAGFHLDSEKATP